MTKEAVEQGNKIIRKIEEIDEIIHSIKPYQNEYIEITISKGLNNYNPDKKYNYKLYSDSPFWVAIGAALEDMKSDLQLQLHNLKEDTKEEPKDPIKKTTAFWKTWLKNK